MTVAALSRKYDLGKRKISDILASYEIEPIVPPENYHCDVICVDVTYVGRKYGYLSVLDAHRGVCLYCDITRGYETVYDYEKALLALRRHGMNILIRKLDHSFEE